MLGELFGWFSDFVYWAASWLPRPAQVDVTEGAVLFTRGQEPKVCKHGLVWWVPALQRLEQYSVLQDAYEFRPVFLVTKDGKAVAVGFSLLWSIEDILLACTTCDDFQSIVKEMGESLLPELVVGHTYEELLSSLRPEGRAWSFNRQLTSSAQALLKPYGLRVHSARINNVAPCRVVRVIQNDARV